MIYLADVREWIKKLKSADYYSVGKIDGTKDKVIGIYQRKSPGTPTRAIGQPSTYGIKPISLLIHWNKNATETEKAAYELYKQLEAVSPCTIGNTQIYMLSLLQSEPIDVGTDENGIYERVIEFDLYYERTE